MAPPKSREGSGDIFSVLFETGKIINSSLDIDSIIRSIVNIVHTRFKFSEFSFLTVEGNKLVLKGGLNHPMWGNKEYSIPIGKGITGDVAETGEPSLVNDVRTDPRYIPVRKDIRSELCVPVKIDRKVVGVFNLENKEINAFTEKDLRLLTAMADQTSLAMKNAQLYQSYKNTIKRLTNVYESGKTINSSLELDNILGALLEVSAKELNFDSIAILIVKDGMIHAKKGRGFTNEEISTYSANVGEGICGRVAETGRSLIYNDVSKCPFYIAQSPRTRSEMAVPIKFGDKVLGVYNVESNEFNTFDEDDLLFVSALAEQTAIALKNAELFEEIKSFNIVLQKKIEEATQELRNANDELLRLNNIKSDFVSIVSHELRTPMTSIIGYIDLIRDGETGPISSQQKEFLDITHEESHRLYRLINDLLDIQKIDSKKMIYLFKDFDMAKFFEKYARTVERDCKAKNLSFSLKLPDKIPVIKADEDKFRQIVTNLVSNALKFTRKGGITIEVQVLPEFIQVSVSDTGIGISVENQETVFEKLRQVNMEASREVTGTGLGLAIAKSLVEAHEGKIWVESRKGEGATFTFTTSRNLEA